MSKTFQVVCPACAAVNRLSHTKPAIQGKCGKCKNKLFQGMPLDLTSETFPKHIAHNQIPVLVDFWAEWCGPCKMMTPVFEQAASTMEPRVRIAKLNTEREQIIAAQFGIQSIPTMILFKGGREIVRQSGAMPLQSLMGWLGPHI